ncbi:MAG: hypothetical protein ACTHVE_08480 [Senegalia sp. (in: firmicutes)]|uniref:hypothetical protein n=1 Tax=Senegalia sp. (in: firmicutes) TaxID=1924098 RepID=UPI003F98261B
MDELNQRINSSLKDNILSGLTVGQGIANVICGLFGSSLISIIPISALVGIMFIVVISTFEWSAFGLLTRIPKSDALIIIVVSVVTVFTNLAISVAIGTIFSALVFAWNKEKKIIATTTFEEKGIKVYKLEGPLFFGAAKDFSDSLE